MTDNCSFAVVNQTMAVLELVIYIPIFLCGLILNVAALVIFCVFLRKWTEPTIYMCSLALMDLLLVFLFPFKMHASNHVWLARLQPLCSFLECLYFVGIYGSIYTILCIAVDRWVAICHPLRAKLLRSPRGALLNCLLVWVLVAATVSLTTPGFREGPSADFHCFHGFSKRGWSPRLVVCLLAFGFLLPALVLVYCSVKTIWALRESGQHSSQSQACVKIIYSSLSAFLVPFTLSHLGILLQFLVRRMVPGNVRSSPLDPKRLDSHTMTFFCCFASFQVHQGVIQDCGARVALSLFLQVSLCLSNITCCLDALCYYFIAHEVRSSKHRFKLSITSQRRVTISTSEA